MFDPLAYYSRDMKNFDDFLYCCEHGEFVWATRRNVNEATKSMWQNIEKSMYEMAQPRWIVKVDGNQQDHMIDAIRYGGYSGMNVIKYKGPPPQLITGV